MTRPYTNPYGVHAGACVYCGYCERFPAGGWAPRRARRPRLLPVLMKSPNYELPHARERGQGEFSIPTSKRAVS